MALLYSEEEPKELANKERKKKAFLHLVLTLIIIDTLAVIGYLVLVYVFGWEGMVPLILLLAASMFTGMYFQEGKRKIGGDFCLINRVVFFSSQPDRDFRFEIGS